ncbi:MAG: hypothetical protein GWP59_05795 [Chlamydiales bacterium]|nr:hypothetical protein [Chlamydiales bacterium]
MVADIRSGKLSLSSLKSINLGALKPAASFAVKAGLFSAAVGFAPKAYYALQRNMLQLSLTHLKKNDDTIRTSLQAVNDLLPEGSTAADVASLPECLAWIKAGAENKVTTPAAEEGGEPTITDAPQSLFEYLTANTETLAAEIPAFLKADDSGELSNDKCDAFAANKDAIQAEIAKLQALKVERAIIVMKNIAVMHKATQEAITAEGTLKADTLIPTKEAAADKADA